MASLEERFWAKVDCRGDEECWPWIGANNGNGYGRLTVNRRRVYAHRVSYELEVGSVPQGFELDHLCRNRICVNPRHLEPVTHRENALRGLAMLNGANNRNKTECPQGHPYTGDNVYRNKLGSRECRTCNRAKVARYRAKKQGARA